MNKILILLLLLASQSRANVTDAIGLYDNKHYADALLVIGFAGSINEHFWRGKIYEASGDTTSAINSYEMALKFTDIYEDNDTTNFMKTENYPELVYRMAKIYETSGDDDGYDIAKSLLKTIGGKKYLKKLHYIDESSLLKLVREELESGTMITTINYHDNWVAVETDADHVGVPNPMHIYYCRRSKGKWEMMWNTGLRDASEWDQNEKNRSLIPNELRKP